MKASIKIPSKNIGNDYTNHAQVKLDLPNGMETIKRNKNEIMGSIINGEKNISITSRLSDMNKPNLLIESNNKSKYISNDLNVNDSNIYWHKRNYSDLPNVLNLNDDKTVYSNKQRYQNQDNMNKKLAHIIKNKLNQIGLMYQNSKQDRQARNIPRAIQTEHSDNFKAINDKHRVVLLSEDITKRIIQGNTTKSRNQTPLPDKNIVSLPSAHRLSPSKIDMPILNSILNRKNSQNSPEQISVTVKNQTSYRSGLKSSNFNNTNFRGKNFHMIKKDNESIKFINTDINFSNQMIKKFRVTGGLAGVGVGTGTGNSSAGGINSITGYGSLGGNNCYNLNTDTSILTNENSHEYLLDNSNSNLNAKTNRFEGMIIRNSSNNNDMLGHNHNSNGMSIGISNKIITPNISNMNSLSLTGPINSSNMNIINRMNSNDSSNFIEINNASESKVDNRNRLKMLLNNTNNNNSSNTNHQSNHTSKIRSISQTSKSNLVDDSLVLSSSAFITGNHIKDSNSNNNSIIKSNHKLISIENQSSRCSPILLSQHHQHHHYLLNNIKLNHNLNYMSNTSITEEENEDNNNNNNNNSNMQPYIDSNNNIMIECYDIQKTNLDHANPQHNNNDNSESMIELINNTYILRDKNINQDDHVIIHNTSKYKSRKRSLPTYDNNNHLNTNNTNPNMIKIAPLERKSTSTSKNQSFENKFNQYQDDSKVEKDKNIIKQNKPQDEVAYVNQENVNNQLDSNQKKPIFENNPTTTAAITTSPNLQNDDPENIPSNISKPHPKSQINNLDYQNDIKSYIQSTKAHNEYPNINSSKPISSSIKPENMNNQDTNEIKAYPLKKLDKENYFNLNKVNESNTPSDKHDKNELKNQKHELKTPYSYQNSPSPRTELKIPEKNVDGSSNSSNNNNNNENVSKALLTGSDDETLRARLINLIKEYFFLCKQAPPTTLEYYRLIKMIGKGAFGKVYLGVHLLTGKYVAIKAIEKQYIKDEVSKKKIFQEVMILHKICHKNIIRLLEVFENKKYIFIVTEYAANGDLRALIKKQGKMTESKAKKFFCQIVEGIKYCHSLSILHRDIKLDNILLDHNNNVKICDFGVSRFVKKGQIITEQCGTPAYIAPEIIQDKGYQGCYADIWSLGVLLYAIVTGTVPFKAKSLEELHSTILAAKYTFPSELSKNVMDLIDRMIKLNPYSRIDIEEILKHPWFKDINISQLIENDIYSWPKGSATYEFNSTYKTKDLKHLNSSHISNNNMYNYIENLSSATTANSTRGFSLAKSNINEIITKKVEAYGYPREYILKSLQSNNCNHATASYFLLYKEYIEKGKE